MMKFLQILCVFIGVSALSQAPVNVKVKDNAGNESFQVTCTNDLDANGCISLNVEYPALKQTTAYEVTQESYNPPVPLNQGTALNANYDDLFAVKLNLPFKFCFYNQYFEALVVGSNGMVTFDLSQLGNINYPNIQWQNPNANLPKNSIFGVYHDMVFSANDSSEIYYSTVGTAPYRKFVISFFDGRVTGCTDRSSSQIVLHETTNIIDVFVEKKLTPCPTRKFENALIGIINSNGSQGVSPASRNTGVWQALQEGWRFNPSGSVIQPQVTWTNTAGQTVGTGIQTTVCPTQSDVYTANVVFNICGNSNLALTDDFPVTFDPSYPAAKNYTQNFCGNTNLTLNSFQANLTTQNPANFNFSFHTSLQDAQNNVNPLPNNYSLTANTVLYVRIQNPSVPTCYRVAVLTLNLLSKSLLKNTVELCDTNNDGTEANYNLTLLNTELFVAGTTGITYYASQADAQNNANAITTANITTATQLWIRLQEGTCTYILGPVNFQFRPGVNMNSPLNFTYSICDINADNQEAFDYPLTVGPLITTQPGATFAAYNTYNEAFTGSGAVLNVIKEGIYTIYVRVQIPNGCFAVATVNMNVTFTRITANEKTEYICFNGTEDVSVNLGTLSAGMLILPATVPTTEYYANYNDATSGTNPISVNQTITADGNFVTQVYFVKFRIADDCYTIRPITVNLVHPVAVQSSFTVCDISNNNSENVVLSQFAAAIVGTQNAGVIFYLTAADAAAGTNPVTNITLTGTQQVFAKINSYNCQQVYPVTLSLTSTPVVNSPVNIVLNNICDNNNDGAEIYNLTQAQPQIYTGTNVSFTYYLNYNAATNVFSNPVTDPTQFTVSGGNATVYVKVQFNNNGCFSAAQINIQMNFLPAVILGTTAALSTCDEDFDLNETFQLNDAVPQLFTASQNTYPLSDMTITYYNTAAQANAGNPANQIGNNITTTVSTVQVWARFQSKTTGCYSVAPVQLNTYFPPKAINSTITVCDENLDGSYEVNLLNFTNLMVDIQNPANTFTFYLTQQDAQNGTNAIANPANFTANPFPAQIWVRVQNIPGCDDIATVSFVFGNKVTLQNAGPFQLAVCDQGSNGSETVDLTQFQSQIYTGANVTFTYYPSLADLNAGTNAIATPGAFVYSQNSVSSTVYVKVSVPGSCSNVAEIKLSLKPVPFFNIPTLYFCPEGTLDYTVAVEGFTITGYVWTNPSGQVISTTDTVTGITTVGNYTLTVTADNGCSYTDTFEIRHYDVPVITSLDFNGNTATVQATGLQTILYSIDGTTWQAGNVFYNLPTGITTFYVKYVNSECIVRQQGVVLDIKNAITPNGDGLNDHWIVKNLHVFGSRLSNVKIFDRYQMLIFEQSSNTQFYWDGTMKGRAIPTSSYWYVVTLPDGRTFTGWILVKNNN